MFINVIKFHLRGVIKMKKKNLLCVLITLVMCLVTMPAANISAATVLTENKTGNEDGYDYELWKDSGNTTMTLTGGGTFSCEWSNINNALFRKGIKFDCTQTYQEIGNISIDFSADYNPSGNSYLCVYGWTKEPLVEYYIVEAWGSWRPPGATSKGTVVIDGGTYDIYVTTRENQPSIIGNTTFQQYWSVRTDKRTSGTISVSKHFQAWEDMGMPMGKLYEAALNVEGYQSSGSATITKNDISVGGEIPDDDGQVDVIEPDANGYYFHSTYESGSDSWSARGDSRVASSSSAAAAGSKSLFVSGRTDAWNGTGYSLSTAAFVPGKSYSFSAMVMQNASASEDLKLSLQYNDASGEPQYVTVAEATAAKGEWTQLSNTSFTIPSGASSMLLYIETPENLIDFYVDEAIGAVGGTVIKPAGGSADSGEDDTPETDADGYYFHSTYESGIDRWAERGGTSVSSSSSASYAGEKSLSVTGRTDTWNGAGYTLDTSVFAPGKSYSFSSAVMQNTEATADFKLSLQYKDASGEPQYATIAEAAAAKGKWTQLSNTSFTIPSGASELLLYVETDDSLTDFYMDEAIGAPDGTVIDFEVTYAKGDVNHDGTIDADDLIALSQYLLGAKDASLVIYEDSADIDGSGKIDSMDMVGLRKILA